MGYKKPVKKTLILAAILIAGWLFYEGAAAFFSPKIAANPLTISDNQTSVPKNYADSSKPIIKEKFAAGILQNISDALKKPFIKSTTISVETETVDLPKTSLENYFIASSGIEFPDTQLVSDAIKLHEQSEDKALKLLIEIMKEKNKELYEIVPPPEAKTIHNDSLWISGKFIEILEKVLKTNNEQEILKILDSPETEEMRDMAENTKIQIKELIDKYKLEVKI